MLLLTQMQFWDIIGEVTAGKLKGNPTIKNHVWIGANAVIVGNVTIGEYSLIAPNSYVNFDVPAHSIVIGNQIHHKEFAMATKYWAVNVS